MPQTNLSGNSAYCTNQQVVDRWDWRPLGRLLEDVPAGGTPTLTSQSAVVASALLTELTQEAAGEIEMACLEGERYYPADLAALVGTNAGQRLAGLNADLAVWRILDRRTDRDAKIPPRCQAALDLLERLRRGEMVFPFKESAVAGHLEHDEVTAADLRIKRDRIRIQRRYLGRRADEEANGRQA